MHERVHFNDVIEITDIPEGTLRGAIHKTNGNTVVRNGWEITQVEAQDDEKQHHAQKFVYNVTRAEQDIKEVADAPSIIEEWQTLRASVLQQRQQEKQLQEQVQENILDEEVWELIEEMRQEAIEDRQKIRDKLSEFVFEHAEHLFMATPDDDPDWLVDPQELDDPEEAQEETTSALVYGGHESQKTADKLKERIGVDNIDWLNCDEPRRAQSAVERVQNGSYDVVFALIKHARHRHVNNLKEACEGQETTFVRVPHGKSAKQVVTAMQDQT